MRLHNGEQKIDCLCLELYVGRRAALTFARLTKINIRLGITEDGCT